MKEFFDTSVLVASFWGNHNHHLLSLRRFAAAEKKNSACGLHSIAEVYAVMTALPVRPPIPPEQVLLFIKEIQARLTLVSLTLEEYWSAIRQAADRGISGGRVYDSLLLSCAAKSKAQHIYTWNLKHFQAIAPSMSSRICTP
jgi:predicted nucleic acid-binding protein